MFKDGDIISPVTGGSRWWYNSTIIKYYPRLKEADLELNDGEIVHGFNLDPKIGVKFKVVGRK